MTQKSKKNDTYLDYMDGVCVKISEKFKPPKRISLSQRNTCNDSTISQSFHYDFNLEKSLCNKIDELRNARKLMHQERCKRLTVDKHTKETSNNRIVNSQSEWVNVNSNTNENVTNKEKDTNIESRFNHKFRELSNETMTHNSNNPHNLLLPTPAYLPVNSNPSSILTPVQICSHIPNTNSYNHSKRSPFNISDFENDTSSPFDNMELKTLNDMEELAQVLQPDVDVKTNLNQCNNGNVTISNHLPFSSSENTSYTNQTMMYKNNLRFMNPPSASELPFVSHHNEIAYNSQATTSNVIQSLNEILSVSYPNTASLNQNTVSYSFQNQKSSSRSVPDIMQALEKELQSKVKLHQSENVTVSNISSASDKTINEDRCKDDLPNPFDSLNDNLQKVALEVSQMGFPIERVARACNALGDNQEKIVEHVIALSELMDVGFSESQVAEVLIKCNNDRDKALDYLIK